MFAAKYVNLIVKKSVHANYFWETTNLPTYLPTYLPSYLHNIKIPYIFLTLAFSLLKVSFFIQKQGLCSTRSI